MAVVTETRAVGGFDEVCLRGYGDLVVEQNDGQAGPEELVIEAERSIMDRLSAETRGHTLVLGFRMPWYEWISWGLTWAFLPHRGIRYTLRANHVRGLVLTGSGRIRSAHLAADRCSLRISGSGGITVDALSAGAFEASVSGSGSISCSGQVQESKVEISGSGSVKTGGLAARSARVGISGSGGVSLSASESLQARITGSGSISYHGSPRVSSTITGSGRLVALKD